MFSKIGAAAIKADLFNTLELCRILGDPHKKIKTIHVGGTNGKGSTSHMLAAILQIAGYKTGLYTSPHLRDFRERIRVNGEMISEGAVINFVQEQKENIEKISPSFFEVTVAMAFDHFAKQSVDIAIIEVGLGGRLDSTNIITPILSVITNIGYDHMNILGNTLTEIASEKAGIIKSEIPVVIGEKQNEISEVFIKKTAQCKSEIIFASEEWTVELNQGIKDQPGSKTLDLHATSKRQQITYNIQLDLTGKYQLKNVKTVLSAVLELRKQGFEITETHIQTALRQVITLTGLKGRWQIIGKDPLIVCDTGHNEDGIREVLKNIEAISHEKLHMVIGFVKDKNIHKILSILPINAIYYFCNPPLERAKPAQELLDEALAIGLHGESYATVNDALEASKKAADREDLIFIGGSTFVVAEIV
ncbi:MAG TPA: folylpolyglutamate synthase/dihydrofolate synthase family protein [Sphingobacteriaceae bacterium]|nr:folylpolyglutamate synthase/dihydrofolate synthase family protein [Sphingobacteriaceae bacterium]